MNKQIRTLHFAFSPVQGFVSQARRTRDLWAGSYLLSWLAGQAMQALIPKGGKIQLPDVENDPLFQQICSPEHITLEDQAAYLGSLPNRFTVTVPEGVDGTTCTKAIDQAWLQVTKAVFAIIGDYLQQEQIDVWKKQTKEFWECTWVIGEKISLLDQRKNLRLHFSSPEEGEKCTVCGERQELSCEEYPRRKDIQKWWKGLIKATSASEIHGLDLRENERLCAICLTKRLFPHVAQQAIGWQVPEFYPSTPYLSAIDWIIHVLEIAKEDAGVKDAAAHLLNMVKEPIVKRAEKRNWAKIQKIQELVEDLPELRQFLSVDGSVFFQDAIQHNDLQLDNRFEVSTALSSLQKAVEKAEEIQKQHVGKASPFYAILLMDGDNMGQLIGNHSKDERAKISKALASFTALVPEIVREQNGLLLYAGGDDVFALLPVSIAIECARRCRFAYQCAFKEHAPFVSQTRTTISAAVQYAHMNTALGVVVRDAHRLLDDIAKDKTGRDALACRVWKRGGPVLTWSQPWSVIDDGLLITSVQKAFTDDTDKPDRFSSKFFYKLRDLFELVNTEEFIAHNEDIKDLLVAEYLANREHSWPDEMTKQEILDTAVSRIRQLLHLCLEQQRTIIDNSDVTTTSTGKYNDAGALLVRFLTQKEV